MIEKIQSFKGKQFKVIKGTTHPEYSFFTFESEELDFKEKYWNIRLGDVVYDIGASYGGYALTACALGARAVFAFEPEKTVFCGLVDNANINNWNGTSCFPINCGVWSSKDVVDMKEYAPHWPAATISGKYDVDTIDSFTKTLLESNKIVSLDWIKIDVEGAEDHVIRGGLDTIKKYKPNLIIECHTFMNNKENIANEIKEQISAVAQYDFEEVSRPPCVMLIAKAKSFRDDSIDASKRYSEIFK